MSLSKIQEPLALEIAHKEQYYSIKSDSYVTPGFKYVYNIVEENGNFIGNGVAVEPFGNTYINVQNVVKNFGDFTFQPDMSGFSPVPNALKQYQLIVKEGLSEPDIVTYTKKNVLNAWDENATRSITIVPQGHTNFLLKNKIDHKVRYIDSYTLRTLNGELQNTLVDTSFYLIGLTLTQKNGWVWKGYINIGNPYKTSNDTSFPSGIVKNVDNNIIDIGVGPKNLNGLTFYKKLLIYPTGEEQPVGSNMVLNFVDPKYATDTDIISYEAYLLGSTNITNIKSSKHKFNLICNQTRRFQNGIQLAWQNSYGGVDYFLFNYPNEETLNVDRSVYDKNRYKGDSTGHISTSNISKGTTTYNTNVYRTYKVRSGYLKKQEIDFLRDLWISPNVYANIEGEWYSVINIANNMPIYSKQSKGQVSYNPEIRISNKINF